MFDSEDVAFAWAIGKASLIVILSVGALVYVAWLATRKKEIIARVDIPKNAALRSTAVEVNAAPALGLGKIGPAEGVRDILSVESTRSRSA